jgi:hypothetical protein
MESTKYLINPWQILYGYDDSEDSSEALGLHEQTKKLSPAAIMADNVTIGVKQPVAKNKGSV